MPTMSPEQRKKSFAQFELGYGEKEALAEARRCLSCAAGATVEEDKCASCVTCVRVCPFGVPVINEAALMSSDMCQACGLCVVECPARCISVKRFHAVGDITSRIVELMESAETPVTRVEIVCSQDAEAREELLDRVVTLDGEVVARVPVTCAALTDEVDMMKPFELDARSVVVRRCSQCRYRGAEDRLAKRVERTKDILTAVGIAGDRLTLE